MALTKNFAKPRSPGWVFPRGLYGRISMILTILFLINWSVFDLPGRDHAQLNVPLGTFPYQEPSAGYRNDPARVFAYGSGTVT